MLNRWIQTLSKWVTWKILLGLFLLLAVFTFVIFPAGARRLQAAGASRAILDKRFSYTPGAAYSWMGELGEAGRRMYVASALSLDLLYPIAYALFFSLLILALYRRGFPDLPAAQNLALLPFAMLLADVLENISVATLLLRYPQQLPGLARAASLFTSLKWSLGSLVVIILFIGLPGWLTAGGGRRPRPHGGKA